MKKDTNKIYNILTDFVKELGKLDNENYDLLVPIFGDDGKEDYDIINDFKYRIYNEISLQHELGKYLEDKLKNEKYKIFYEKNMYKCKKEDGKGWFKKEVDIVLVDNKDNKYAIELKFPQSRNGQVPEQMYQFVKDICFMEKVIEKKAYIATFNLIIVNDAKYYLEHNKNDKYYAIFRNDGESIKLEKGKYSKPTGKKSKEKIEIKREYNENWRKIFNEECEKLESYEKYKDYRYLLITQE